MKNLIIKIDGKSYNVEVEEIGAAAPSTAVSQPAPAPAVQPSAPRASSAPPAPAAPSVKAPVNKGANVVTAPMPGKIISVKVKPGQTVKEGDLLLILEAMKMENEIYSSYSGTIKEIRVSEGAVVNPGDIMVVM